MQTQRGEGSKRRATEMEAAGETMPPARPAQSLGDPLDETSREQDQGYETLQASLRKNSLRR